MRGLSGYVRNYNILHDGHRHVYNRYLLYSIVFNSSLSGRTSKWAYEYEYLRRLNQYRLCVEGLWGGRDISKYGSVS